MNDLDAFTEFTMLDKKGQLNWISNWSTMIQNGFNNGNKIKISPEISNGNVNIRYSNKYNQIGICGMGGSGISGEFIQNYLSEYKFSIPVSVIRGYKLPIYFTSQSLMLIVSYSGNTRETLFCLLESLKRNIPIILISSGGLCKELAEKMNFPFVELPTGYEPRAAFPLLFGAIAGVLYNLFLDLKFLKQDLDSLSNLLQKTNEKYEPSRLLKENLAKQLAKKWLDVVPIFISEYSCLGMRMKGQMNENSKKIAFYDVFPEMMHNTTQSWKDVQLNLLPLHFIRIVIHENTEMSDKTNYGLELAHYKSLSQVDELDFSQTSKNLLEKLFLATYLVDYASIYIAFLKDVDPSFIDIVVGMKDKFEPILNKQYDIRLALLEMV
jgi:glucose/mannose-6-phosphate isomerase